MFEINLNKLMSDLVSENFEIQVEALEQVSDILSVLAEQCVKALAVSDNPYLIAERLAYLGTRIVPPLEKFVGEGEGVENEKRVLGSIVLLRLGSKKGLNYVIEELKKSGKNQYLATRTLVQARVPEAAELIIERLRRFTLMELTDNKESIFVSNLLSYLRELCVPLPVDLINKLVALKGTETYKYYSEYL